MTTAVEPESRLRGRLRRAVAAARRVPFSLSLVGLLLFFGVTTGALWHPIYADRWTHLIGYSLPALEDERWWTLITSLVFLPHPLSYLWVILFVGVSSAWLERRRGSAVAARYFIVGQVGAMLVVALMLAVFDDLGWAWADHVAQQRTLGPFAGLAACLTGAVNSLAEPWRRRGRLILLYTAIVAVLFLGSLRHLLVAVAIIAILIAGRRGVPSVPSAHERRVTSFITILTLGVVQIIVVLVPTWGPFGRTRPFSGAWIDVAIDAAIILLLANGLRVGRRLAWLIALMYACINVIVGGLLLAVRLTMPDFFSEQQISRDAPSVIMGTSVLWLIFAAYLVLSFGAFTVPIRRRFTAGRGLLTQSVRGLLQRNGGGTTSWMGTWPDNLHYFTGSGMISYQLHARTAIALGDPVGPATEIAAMARSFIAEADRSGYTPCFFVASQGLRDALPEWKALLVAEDTIVDLPELAFTGKRWNSVRTSLNKADREGVRFRLTHLSEEPRRIQQQVRAISEGWLGDKGLPEMGFTLGGVDEALDPDVRLALATNEHGEIDGFLSWLPVYGPEGVIRGWTLDLMRRREGGFGPVMEYLIGRSAQEFRDEGALIMSLSGAPLAHLGATGAPSGTLVDTLVSGLGAAIEPLYGFRSLHAFKRKFNPRYESLYLLYRDEGELARVGLGLGRAFLPNENARSILATGVHTLRSR